MMTTRTINEQFVNRPFRRNKSLSFKFATRMRKLFRTSNERSRELSSEFENSTFEEILWEPNTYTKRLIFYTWTTDLEVCYQLGSEIYQEIYTSVPDAPKLFPGMAKYGEDWKDSKEFKVQSLRFVQVMSKTVRNLHDLQGCHQSTLYNVGRAHCKYADRGFRHQHWLLFQNVIKKVMKRRVEEMNDLDEKEKKDVMKAWYYLAEQIIHGMQKGFKDGIKAGKRKLSY